MFNLDPMGRSQVPKGDPINYQPPSLILFINQLNSPKSWLGNYCLGTWEVWESVSSARVVSLDHMISQGKGFLAYYPRVEESKDTNHA